MQVKLVAVALLSQHKLLPFKACLILGLILLTLVGACKKMLEPVPVVTSAEANVVISLQVKDGIPLMKVDYKNRSIINPSPFIFSFSESIQTKYSFGEIIPSLSKGTKQLSLDSTFKVFNVYNDMSVKLLSDDSLSNDIEVLFRVYEEGFGWKYKISEQQAYAITQNLQPDSTNTTTSELNSIELELADDLQRLDSEQLNKAAFEIFQRKNDRIIVGIESAFLALFQAYAGNTDAATLAWKKVSNNYYESDWIIIAVDEVNDPKKRTILRAKLRQ